MRRTRHTLNAKELSLPLGGRTAILGIVNVTPDSFSDGGTFLDADSAVQRGMELHKGGADLIDVGGESTRPGAAPVSADEERDRVLPVIEGIRKRSAVPISIDTSKAAVARDAVARGACLINDVTALTHDPDMVRVVRDAGAAVCLMHMKGTPRTMQRDPRYDDVVSEVKAFLLERAQWAIDQGVPSDRILLDPGIGFGKRLEHNLALIRACGTLGEGRFPVLVGASRKSFLGQLLDLPVEERRTGSVASAVVAALQGAHLVRVHDVLETRQALDVADAVSEA